MLPLEPEYSLNAAAGSLATPARSRHDLAQQSVGKVPRHAVIRRRRNGRGARDVALWPDLLQARSSPIRSPT
jgi:hypothetical protein